jgi:hypothetical protein
VFVKEPWRRDYLTDSTTAVPVSRQFELAYDESPYGRLWVAGDLQQPLHRAGWGAPSTYRRQAVGVTAGLPSWVAKQVTRPIRNQEAPAPSRS